MGCTEPVAIAYAAALARRALGKAPEQVDIEVSGNILKNVKSVIVPNTGGLRGIASAVAAGCVAGNADGELEVLSAITKEDYPQIAAFAESCPIRISQAPGGCIFDIRITAQAESERSFVRIEGYHTNVVRIEKNGEPLLTREAGGVENVCQTDRSILSVEGVVEFADCVAIEDVREIIERQINYNTAIAKEGLSGAWGASVGKTILAAFGDSVQNLAKATAAAGSDARMNGCELPVVIVSGSGNQGMTASLPVIVYAHHHGFSHERLIRSLVVSNLLTVHMKTGIGRLSAYCGAVSAGAGAGCGISYLLGGRLKEISHTLVNALAIDSGMICDGAKSSCAAKIASAVDAGILGMEMYRRGHSFKGGDGIVERGVENTISNVGEIARIGMRETDEEIIKLMIKTL
ncbi:MAG: serine dehydratase subunit alpha family protein [Clostridia bacterium]|nr:serine dehydratase subunit alpha family protein [Clostridia bacterium]